MRSAAGAEQPEQREGEAAERRVSPLGSTKLKKARLVRAFFNFVVSRLARSPSGSTRARLMDGAAVEQSGERSAKRS